MSNPTYSRLMRISNRQSKNQFDTPTKFKVNVGGLEEMKSVVRIVVKSVEFSNTFYNITELNNTFEIEFSIDGPISITPIRPGNYTTSQLINLIVTDIQGQLSTGTFDITQDTNTGKLTFSIVGGAIQTLQLWAAEDAPNGSTLSPFLGIINTSNFTTFATATRLPNLYGVTKAYLHCLALAEGNLVDGDIEVHDIVSEIPITVSFGSMNHYQSRDDELDSINYNTPRDNIDTIDIALKDIDENILTLQGGDLTIILKLYYL